MHKAGKWQPWQEEIVIQLYATEKSSEIALKIGRSKSAVDHYASRNGLAKDADAAFKHRSEAKKCERAANFKGYRWKTKKGYFMRYAPWHPNSGKNGYVMEHRLVMEGLIGRKLENNEVVHHINGNKSDNSPENLMLMTFGEHTAYHNSTRRKRNE